MQSLFYEFIISGEDLCRKGAVSAEALLVQLGNVSAKLDAAFKMAQLIRIEVHGSSRP